MCLSKSWTGVQAKMAEMLVRVQMMDLYEH